MSERNRSFDKPTISEFWRSSLRFKKDLLMVTAYPLGSIALNTFVPLYIGKILASLAKPSINQTPLIAGFIIAAILGLVLNRYGFVALMTFQARVSVYLQTRTMDVLLKRSVGFHNNNISGKIVSDAIDYPTAFVDLTNALFINMLPFTIILIAGLAIVSAASLVLGGIVAAMAFFTILSAWIDSRRRFKLRVRRMEATKKVTGHLADTIVNVQTVKTFAGEPRELAESRRLNKILLDLRLHDWRLAAVRGNDRMIGLMILQLAYILLIISEVHRNPALLGVGIFAFSMTITMTNRLFELNSMIRTVEESLLKASPMTEILLQKPEVNDTPNAQDLKVRKGEIVIDAVNFQYEDANEKVVFGGLSLKVNASEKIGLVGPSGGGKSTLTRLLLRFEDLNGGRIVIDGQDIANVTQESLRKSIAYVPQEPLLFHRSIFENIAYGQEGADEKAVRKAAILANADSFIEELPHGYETIVGERGVKLSGGQRQRVAIARALLKDAPVLILDEATSALDSESEKLIQDALLKLMERRTAIVIAHRLSTIQRMDRIIVLDEGKIVEEGSHKDLLAQGGTYARLWAHQSGGFLED
jgi:ATP-binding cassette, subfamily B, bacterial